MLVCHRSSYNTVASAVQHRKSKMQLSCVCIVCLCVWCLLVIISCTFSCSIIFIWEACKNNPVWQHRVAVYLGVAQILPCLKIPLHAIPQPHGVNHLPSLDKPQVSHLWFLPFLLVSYDSQLSLLQLHYYSNCILYLSCIPAITSKYTRRAVGKFRGQPYLPLLDVAVSSAFYWACVNCIFIEKKD